MTDDALRSVPFTKVTTCEPALTWTFILGVVPTGRPSSSTLETGIELMFRVAPPPPLLAWATGAGDGAGVGGVAGVVVFGATYDA